MINLKHFIEAKQIKFVHKIINYEPEHWNIIGKYWLSSFDQRYDSENFLFRCSNIKGLQLQFTSKFYKEAVASWCSFRSKLQANVSFPILEEQICGNNKILHKNCPLFFEQFNKSGLKTIKNIWDRERMNFVDENVVLHRLTDKRNAIRKYRINKSSINEKWVNQLESSLNQGESLEKVHDKLQKCLYNDLGKQIKISLKQIQNILKIDMTFKPNYIAKWEAICNINTDWKKQWTYSRETPLSSTSTEKQQHWKIKHNAIFTKCKLSLMGKSEGKCHFCKSETEYLTHLFYECRIIKDVIKNIEAKINNTLQSKGYRQQKLNLEMVIVGVIENEECVRIFLNTILQIFKWELWKIRNLIKYENVRYTSGAITKTILNKVKACSRF